MPHTTHTQKCSLEDFPFRMIIIQNFHSKCIKRSVRLKTNLQNKNKIRYLTSDLRLSSKKGCGLGSANKGRAGRRGERATGLRGGAGSAGLRNALEDILVNMRAEVAGLGMTGQNSGLQMLGDTSHNSWPRKSRQINGRIQMVGQGPMQKSVK